MKSWSISTDYHILSVTKCTHIHTRITQRNDHIHTLLRDFHITHAPPGGENGYSLVRGGTKINRCCNLVVRVWAPGLTPGVYF